MSDDYQREDGTLPLYSKTELALRQAIRERDEARKIAGKYWSRPSGYWGQEPELDEKRYPWLQEASDAWWKENR